MKNSNISGIIASSKLVKKLGAIRLTCRVLFFSRSRPLILPIIVKAQSWRSVLILLWHGVGRVAECVLTKWTLVEWFHTLNYAVLNWSQLRTGKQKGVENWKVRRTVTPWISIMLLDAIYLSERDKIWTRNGCLMRIGRPYQGKLFAKLHRMTVASEYCPHCTGHDAVLNTQQATWPRELFPWYGLPILIKHSLRVHILSLSGR